MSDLKCREAANLAHLNNEKLDNLIQVSKIAAKKGGDILLDYYGKLNNIRSKGRAGDLVTEADYACEKVVISYLNEKTPEISILAEESGFSGSKDELCWCLDPLDGTTNYAHGYPFFATSIGLTWRDIPILGSISIPFMNELFWGAPHIGAYCNNNPIKVSTTSSLIDSLLVTGFAYDRFTRQDNNYAEFNWLTHRTRGVRRGGAAAVDLAYIACGRLDGYWERGLAKWDLAAGVALVELAGGIVTNYPNIEFDLESGRVLASSPGIHKELQDELSKVIPLEGSTYGAPEIRNTES